MEERHLSLSQVAEVMGKNERTIRRWIKSGKLRAYKPGRDYLIPQSALEELLEGSEVFPKLQARLPLLDEEASEEALVERRVRAFLSSHPSEEERVRTLERTANIIGGYNERWRLEIAEVERKGTFPYGKSIEMDALRIGIFEAIANDGTLDYAGLVDAGQLEASGEERAALNRVVAAYVEMFNLVNRMQEVERTNRESANEGIKRGLEQLEGALSRAPEEEAEQRMRERLEAR